jgi:hypothetical protein
LLVLLGAHHILHVGRIRVNVPVATNYNTVMKKFHNQGEVKMGTFDCKT